MTATETDRLTERYRNSDNESERELERERREGGERQLQRQADKLRNTETGTEKKEMLMHIMIIVYLLSISLRLDMMPRDPCDDCPTCNRPVHIRKIICLKHTPRCQLFRLRSQINTLGKSQG